MRRGSRPSTAMAVDDINNIMDRCPGWVTMSPANRATSYSAPQQDQPQRRLVQGDSFPD